MAAKKKAAKAAAKKKKPAAKKKAAKATAKKKPVAKKKAAKATAKKKPVAKKKAAKATAKKKPVAKKKAAKATAKKKPVAKKKPKKAPAKPEREKYPPRQGISDDVVKDRTGRVWAEWFYILDKADGRQAKHATLARMLSTDHGVKEWWAQTITIRYEQVHGLREVGQTSKGWQAQAQKTVGKRPGQVWEALMRSSSRGRWLGSMVVRMELREGARFRLADGSEGELRALRSPKLLRLSWDHGTGDSSTLELTLTGKGGKTAVRLQHNAIPTKHDRELLVERWKKAIDAIARMVA